MYKHTQYLSLSLCTHKTHTHTTTHTTHASPQHTRRAASTPPAPPAAARPAPPPGAPGWAGSAAWPPNSPRLHGGGGGCGDRGGGWVWVRWRGWRRAGAAWRQRPRLALGELVGWLSDLQSRHPLAQAWQMQRGAPGTKEGGLTEAAQEESVLGYVALKRLPARCMAGRGSAQQGPGGGPRQTGGPAATLLAGIEHGREAAAAASGGPTRGGAPAAEHAMLLAGRPTAPGTAGGLRRGMAARPRLE